MWRIWRANDDPCIHMRSNNAMYADSSRDKVTYSYSYFHFEGVSCLVFANEEGFKARFCNQSSNELVICHHFDDLTIYFISSTEA